MEGSLKCAESHKDHFWERRGKPGKYTGPREAGQQPKKRLEGESRYPARRTGSEKIEQCTPPPATAPKKGFHAFTS